MGCFYRGLVSTVFDYIVLGGGPAGYPCAIRLAQRGLKVACVDGRKDPNDCLLGGTCLREGCIPSKGLLDKSWKYFNAKSSFEKSGINVKEIYYDLKKMYEHNNATLKELGNGIDYLFKANGVHKITGLGRLNSPKSMSIKCNDGKNIDVTATRGIIIATGSKTTTMPGFQFDGNYIVSSSDALKFEELPKDLIVIGAGAIGLELGSVWSRLGSNVTIIEYCDSILPNMDIDLSKSLQKSLKKQGISFHLSTKVLGHQIKENKVHVDCGDKHFIADKVLVAIGRSPKSSDLGIDIKKNQRGFIEINNKFETSVPGVFAIGDVVGGPMLAHKAEDEGIGLADILTDQGFYISDVPSVVYTHPEASSVGKTEQEVKESGIEYIVGKFPFSANSRAKVVGETEGLVKVIARKGGSQSILGVHIVGPQAGVLIGEACVAMAYGASPEDISLICHSHPDFNEAIKEASMSAYFKPIHNV